MECVVDEMLEGGRGILEAERHDKVFIEAVSCDKSGFPFFSWGHPEPIESGDDIELCVVLGFVEGI